MWTVYLGRLLLSRSSPIEEVARVQRIHLHQYYDDDSHDYDLALLQLDRPAGARPACLPPPTHQLDPDLLCWVTGWGSLREGGEGGGQKMGRGGGHAGRLAAKSSRGLKPAGSASARICAAFKNARVPPQKQAVNDKRR